MNRIIREARMKDMAEIMKVMDAAKQIMRQSGNMHQWGDGYPSEAIITSDMEKSGAFVIVDDGAITGYFAFLPSPNVTAPLTHSLENVVNLLLSPVMCLEQPLSKYQVSDLHGESAVRATPQKVVLEQLRR